VVTAYSGKPVTAETLPPDWEAQRDCILRTLAAHNCRHNDIKPEEMLVHGKILRLVDFGWACELDRPNPANWPPKLGTSFRCGNNDRCSFNQSIHHMSPRSTLVISMGTLGSS
jgi:serine/threonine protein kinase